MSKETDFFGGFESIAGMLTPNSTKTSKETTEELEDKIVDPPVDDDDAEDDDSDTASSNSPDADKKQDDEGNTKELEQEEPAEEVTDLSEAEPEIAQFVQDKLAEELGWEFEEGEKFKNINDVVEFLKEVVDANSTPQFANEDIQKMNEFVANGGDLYEFIKLTKGDLDIEDIDISDENAQKSVIRELLKAQGYSDARISRSIDRYTDAGVLEEEAEDALESLKELRFEKAEKLLKDKEKEHKVLLEQKQKYVKSVEQTVNTLESVRGIPISDKEKRQLTDYIFKPTADGRTRYQKDYASNVKHLIESAYFTMKGDTFVQKVQRKANSEAAMNLKKKLAVTSKNVPKKGTIDNSAWGLLSSQLRKPN